MTNEVFQIAGIRQEVTASLKSVVMYSGFGFKICFKWKIPSLSEPKTLLLLQLLMALVTCTVVSVVAVIDLV